MYMPGRFRTASRPSRTVMLEVLYSAGLALLPPPSGIVSICLKNPFGERPDFYHCLALNRRVFDVRNEPNSLMNSAHYTPPINGRSAASNPRPRGTPKPRWAPADPP